MAKKYFSKKATKKSKISNTIRFKQNKSSKTTRVKFIQSQKNNLTSNELENFSEHEKITKNFMDAQSAIKLLCCICNKNISHQIKIILEPMCPKFKIHQKGLLFNALCVNCFLLKTKFDSNNNVYNVGNEITFNNYKYTHYRILTKMSEPLFTNDWSLGDEVKLLGAIEKLGLENWEEISKILNKGKFECESHYYTFYYKEKNDYLINDNIVSLNNYSKEQLKQNKIKENKLLSNIEQNMGYIPFAESSKPNRSLLKNFNLQKKLDEKNKIVNQNIYDNLGYWSKRKEFDIEFRNEAEILLSELEFKDSDDPETINMNYKILENYNNILDEREERKKLICDKNLFDVKKQINFDKKLSNEDREIYINSKNNLKYLTKEQFLYIYESNVLEKNIKAILNQLRQYKSLGCKTYEDIQKYVNDLKKENIKNDITTKDDEKMKLRNSTINTVNKMNNKKLIVKKFKKSYEKVMNGK